METLEHKRQVLAERMPSVDEHAQLVALETQLTLLQRRVAATESAALASSDLRAKMDEEGRTTRARITALEAEFRAAAVRERAGAAESASALDKVSKLEHVLREAERKAAAALELARATDEEGRVRLAAARSISRNDSNEPSEPRHAGRLAGAETDAAEPERPAGEVQLRFDFPRTALLGDTASVYWVSEDDTLEHWYADVQQGGPLLLQRTHQGERWRVRDARSGNHLLSVTASEHDQLVSIVPASAVSLEFHLPDISRTRRVLGAAGTAGRSLPPETDEFEGRQQPSAWQPPAQELRLYKAGGQPGAAASVSAGASAERRIGIDDLPAGRLSTNGKAMVHATAGDLFLVADASGRVCAEHAASHELHQHVNVFCAPAGQSLPAAAQKGKHVRVEFVLDAEVPAPASILRLYDAPRAWHKHAEIVPREALAVLTEPGEWWRVRDTASGRVLADVIVSAQSFQRILVRSNADVLAAPQPAAGGVVDGSAAVGSAGTPLTAADHAAVGAATQPRSK